MCGIFGFSVNNERTRRMIPILALSMEGRGRDSWGVTDGITLHKHVGNIGATYIDHGLDTPTYHTRGASVGKVSERNAHPFEYISPTTQKVVVGVHNGHISNHCELKKKYEENRKEFEVDSEHIFAHLAEGLPLEEFDGWGAVVWYEYDINHPEEIRRYISCFNNHAMHVAKLKTGELAFCSDDKPLKAAIRMAGAELEFFYEIKQEWKYELRKDGLYDMGQMKWGGKPVKYEYKHTSHQHQSTFHGTAPVSKSEDTIGEVCLMRGCFHRTSSGGIVCDDCLRCATVDILGVGV